MYFDFRFLKPVPHRRIRLVGNEMLRVQHTIKQAGLGITGITLGLHGTVHTLHVNRKWLLAPCVVCTKPLLRRNLAFPIPARPLLQIPIKLVTLLLAKFSKQFLFGISVNAYLWLLGKYRVCSLCNVLANNTPRRRHEFPHHTFFICRALLARDFIHDLVDD